MQPYYFITFHLYTKLPTGLNVPKAIIITPNTLTHVPALELTH